MTDDELLALARAALPGHKLEHGGEQAQIFACYAVVETPLDPARELGLAQAQLAGDAEIGDELLFMVWSPDGNESPELEPLGLGEAFDRLRGALASPARSRTDDEEEQLAQARQELAFSVAGAALPAAQLGFTLANRRNIPGAVDELSRELVRLLAAQAAAEASWPPDSANDWLDAAFTELNASGIVALHHAAETLSSGWTLAAETATLRGGAWKGATFYHGQDLESAMAGDGLNLAFGVFDDDPSDAAGCAIVETVVACLRRHRLEPAWNGDAGSRITVPLRSWQRRRRDGSKTLRIDSWHPLPAGILAYLPELETLDADADLVDLADLASASVKRLTLRCRRRGPALVALASGLPVVRARFPALEELIIADAAGVPVEG